MKAVFTVCDDSKTPPKPDEKDVRQERLNAPLRANLRKRKQQTRKRPEVPAKDSGKTQVP